MGRNLLNRSFEVLGLDQRIWVSQETGGYGEGATGGLVPVGADAKEHITAKVNFNIPREDSAARSGRSVAVRLSGKKEVDWEWESYIIPGTPDGLGNPTLPPLHELILSCFGSVDLSDPTKVVYRLSRLNDKSFRMIEEASHYARLVTGCVTDEMTFSFPGDSKAMFKASGFGQDVFISGKSNLTVALLGGESSFSVTVGEGKMFEVGSLVDIISAVDGNTVLSSAKKVTGVVGDVVSILGTLSAAPIGAVAIGHAPSTYDPISSETALLGLKGSITFAGFTGTGCQVLMGEVSIKNNFTKKDFIYGTSKTCGYVPDKRRNVSVKVELLLDENNFLIYMKNKQFISEDVTIKLEPQDIPAPAYTSTVGRTFEFNFPKVEFNISSLENPQDGYVKLALEGVALCTDLNNVDNEATLTIK